MLMQSLLDRLSVYVDISGGHLSRRASTISLMEMFDKLSISNSLALSSSYMTFRFLFIDPDSSLCGMIFSLSVSEPFSTTPYAAETCATSLFVSLNTLFLGGSGACFEEGVKLCFFCVREFLFGGC